jgi:hypothetical protein
MVTDEDTKIARPRQIYTGERERAYEPIGEREQKVDPPTGEEATRTLDPAGP